MKNKLTVLHVLNHFHYGGVQKIVHDIVSSDRLTNYILLTKDGFFVNELKQQNNIQIILYKNNLDMLFKLVKLNFSNLDIVHTHNRIHMSVKYILPFVKHCHTFHSAYPDKNYMYKFLSTKNAIAISKLVQDYLKKYKINSKVIYNGIKIENYQYKPLQKSNHKFLYVGRLSPEKGIMELVKTIADQKLDIKLDIIGNGVLLEEIKSFIEKENLKQVNLLGYKDKPFENAQNYKALFIPSKYEGFCLTAIESILSGLLIIPNNLEVIKEILPKLPQELFFDINKEKSFLESLNYLKNNEENLRTILKQENENAKVKYNITNTKNKYIEFYKNILSK